MSKLNIKAKESDFTPTEFYSTKDKMQWLKLLVAFVQSGFTRSKFTKKLYKQLSNCFGHIAHYDIDGFYATWFEMPEQQEVWLEHVDSWSCFGDPAYTWSDVERAFKIWLSDNEEEVLAAIDRNTKVQVAQQKLDEERKASRRLGINVEFKVIAISKQVGSFGHNGALVLSKDGELYEFHVIMSNWQLSEGRVFTVPIVNLDELAWDTLPVECVRRLDDPDPELVAEHWPKAQQEVVSG